MMHPAPGVACPLCCPQKYTINSARPGELRWEVVHGSEADDWGIRVAGENHGQSVAQMMWEHDAKEVVELHNGNENYKGIIYQLQNRVAKLEQELKESRDAHDTEGRTWRMLKAEGLAYQQTHCACAICIPDTANSFCHGCNLPIDSGCKVIK